MIKRILKTVTLACTFATISFLANAKEKVTLTVNTHDGLYIKYFKTKVDAFKQQHSEYDISFNWQQVAENQNEIIQLHAAKQEMPDIVGIEQSHFAEMTLNGLIDDLFVRYDEVLSEDEYSQIIPSRRAIYTYKNHLYGLESALTSMVYYYQPDLLKKYSLTLPNTYTDMINQAKELKKKKIELSFWPATGGKDIIMALLRQRGAMTFDKNGNFVLEEPENKKKALEALEVYYNGIKSGALVSVSNNNYWDATIPTMQKNGRLIGVIGADWWSSCCLKPQLKDMSGQWAIAPLPKFKNGGYSSTVWGGTGFAVSKNSKYKNLALDFLRFTYLSADSQISKFKSIQMYPVTKDGLSNPEIVNYRDPFYRNDVIGKLFTNVTLPSYYQTPNRAYLDQTWDEYGNQFVALKITPEKMLDNLIEGTKIKIEMNE